LPHSLSLPLIKELVPASFDFGSIVLVEFESHSCWYDAALTLASQALTGGVKTDLHMFHKNPHAVRDALARFGLDVGKLRERDLLRIIDSYTVQTGVGSPEDLKGSDVFKQTSLKLTDWAAAAKQQISEGIPEAEKNRLHIDDNLTVLNRYNGENEVIDYWRTRIIPLYRARESVLVNALLTGVSSEGFYKQFEAMCDGIVDFRTHEENGQVENYVRVRTMHGKSFDSRWQNVKIAADGRVSLSPTRRKVTELGIGGWLKGPGKG
jgi:KaiC/GvpD/RAD55 family RecA-like ATPase